MLYGRCLLLRTELEVLCLLHLLLHHDPSSKIVPRPDVHA